ncbi:MAG: PaaI family thioesterase [Thermodesulfobacteriota bacterium]
MTLKIDTHNKINQTLCGEPEFCENGKSLVKLELTQDMAADDKGLVHGGFIFGLADYAAMIAVNHPNVVLQSASAKFLKPSSVGETVTAEAEIIHTEKNRHKVSVSVHSDKDTIFEGEFSAVVLKNHVLGN